VAQINLFRGDWRIKVEKKLEFFLIMLIRLAAFMKCNGLSMKGKTKETVQSDSDACHNKHVIDCETQLNKRVFSRCLPQRGSLVLHNQASFISPHAVSTSGPPPPPIQPFIL